MTVHVELEGVGFRYADASEDGFALEIGALSIDRGERVAVIGPSGSGKTTLLNLIAGVLRPHSGRIRLGEQSLDALSESGRRALRAAEIGIVFQEFELLEHLSALENILLPFRISPRMRVDRESRANARALAERLGVSRVLSRPPSRLSQGERQRIAVCRALITRPSLVMGDEPTGNLDPEIAESTVDLLTGYAQEHDATLLVVTHNHGLLDRFERVIDTGSLAASAKGGVS